MTIAPDSAGFPDVPPGAGVLEHATKIISGKHFPVFIACDPDGHMFDSRPEYLAWCTPQANAAAREVGELFNASATAVARVRGIWIVSTAANVATAAQCIWDINKISAVGTTGSTAITIRRADSNFPALDAGITARYGSTAGGTLDHLFFPFHVWFDELVGAGGLGNFTGLSNQLPTNVGGRVAEVVLRQNQGVQVKHSIAGPAGSTGTLFYFVTD
jgi:hypothetical protein